MKSRLLKILLISVALVFLVPVVLVIAIWLYGCMLDLKAIAVTARIKGILQKKYNVNEASGLCTSGYFDGSPNCSYSFYFYKLGEGPTFEGSTKYFGNNVMAIELTTGLNKSYRDTIKELKDKNPEYLQN